MRKLVLAVIGVAALATAGSARGNEGGARLAAPTSFPAEWGVSPRKTPTPRAASTPLNAKSEEPPEWAKIFVIVVIVLLVVGVLALFIVPDMISDRARRQRFLEAEARYKAALEFLQANPGHQDARIQCLEAGRAFYGITMPNTITVHTGGGRIGTSGHQDNSAGREARIQADIEARIGHLKLPQAGAATSPVSAQPSKGDPFCAACGKPRGDGPFCGKCGSPFSVPS